MHLFFSLVVALLWAVTNIALKHIVGKFNPEATLCMTSLFIAAYALIFLAFNPSTRKEITSKLDIKTAAFVATVAFFGLFFPSFLYYRLLSTNPVHLVMALAYTSPSIVLFLMAIFGRDKLNWKSVAGVLMIVSGVVLCVMSGSKQK